MECLFQNTSLLFPFTATLFCRGQVIHTSTCTMFCYHRTAIAQVIYKLYLPTLQTSLSLHDVEGFDNLMAVFI